jgi:hypothetical protein
MLAPAEALAEDAPPIVAARKQAKAWLQRADGVSPYAPTVPHQAYQPSADDANAPPSATPPLLEQMPGMGSVSRPDAPAPRGWFLAVLIVLVVVAVVIVLVAVG